MKMKKALLLVISSLCLVNFNALSQSMPVGIPVLEDYYRRQQLLGQLDSNISFTIRPLSSKLGGKDGFFPDTAGEHKLLNIKGKWESPGREEITSILPLIWRSQYNSHHPYGWNDGGMIPSAGYQMMLSGGVYAKYQWFSMQLNPELVIASNKDFEGFPTEHHQNIWSKYYDHYYNRIDKPEKFGSGTYKKILPGQSSARITFDPISFGISTENLWWGPGNRNSLLMSNTAPGFFHFTLNTSKPIKTPIGLIEGQIVSGKLENSGYLPPEINRVFSGIPLYVKKNNEDRYFSGMVLSYQPKWVPHLFLGFSNSLQMYTSDRKRVGDYLPVLQPFIKFRAETEDDRKRAQLRSLFARWVWPEAKSEIYFEYGRTNNSDNQESFGEGTGHSRAFIVGLKKLLPLHNLRKDYIQVALEITQLQNGPDHISRPGESWYTNSLVGHGYTNMGEVLGAGIGPGGNLQSLDISFYRGLKRIGLQFERQTQNNDFYYYAFEDIQDWRSHWVDLSGAVNAEWNYSNLLLNAKFVMIRSLNYQWWLRQYDENQYFVPGRDVLNFQAQLGITYRFR